MDFNAGLAIGLAIGFGASIIIQFLVFWLMNRVK